MRFKRVLCLLLVLCMCVAWVPIKTNAVAVSAVVEATLELLYYNEGSYGSVNKNDNGAVSVGKIQWHGNRALNLLKTIVNMDTAAAQNILGASLYNEIVTATNWSTRTVTAAEASALSNLLTTENGKRAQDALATADVTAYINHGMDLGIQDMAALIYFADLENQGGAGMSARVAKSAANNAGSYAAVGLEQIHNAALSDSVAGKYSTRRNRTYEYCLKYAGGGSVTTHTVDSSYATNFTAYPKAKITAENIFDANHNQISSSAWIGTSDQCTIHEVYTDGCCKVTYPLDSGGTRTVYSKISLFNISSPRVKYWISDTEYGDTPSEFKAGNRYYFCYRFYDAMSGKNWDEIENSDYSFTLTFYNPDGSVKYTNQNKFDYDQSWISSFFSEPGTYTAKIVMSGDYTLEGTRTFTVKENPIKVNCSTNSVSLKLGETESQTIYAGYSGYYNGNWVLSYQRSNTNVSCTWGDWTDDHRSPLTIKANAMGTTTVTISIKDKDTGDILDSTTVTVTVGAKAYTVSYNANGGSGAPASQTKYYNTTLTLSSTKPTRAGYSFLGWSTSSTATSATYQPGGSFTGNANTTLYAVWKQGCENGSHSYSYKVSKTPTTSATGTLTGTCSKCSGTTTVTLPKLNTTDYTYKVTKEATCTSDGTARYTWKTTTYGSFYFDVTISKTGHSYTYKATKAPTTSVTGTLTGTCSKCSGTTTVTLPKLNTTDYTYKVTKEATCTSDGTARYTWKTTTYGSFYFDVTISKTGHSYTYKATKAPTASATGTLTGTCSKCSGTTTVTLPKLNTTDYTYKVTKEATCIADGTGRYTWKTTAYGSFYFDVTISKTGHSYTYKATKAPTTSVTGTLTGTCSKCSGTTTVTLPKLNTTDYTYKVTKEATCTADGTARYTWKTTTYGSFYFDVTISKTGHSYTYKATKAPTTSATGTLTGTCSKCSGTTTVTLPKLNTTDYTYKVTKEATCTADGTGRYTWKTTTYGSFYFDVTISKTGHSYTYKATKAPTTSATGTLTGTCSKCSGTTTVTLPKLNTTDYTYKVTKAATCTADGTGRYTWKITTCGDFYFDVTISKTGHSYTYKATKAPTTSATGTLTGTCSKCSGTTTVTLPKLNTTDYTYKVTKEATCTADGTGRYTWKITTCGDFYFDVTISRTDHRYEDGYCKWCGKEEKVYTITWKEAYSSLGGNIAVVFKADLSKALAEDPNAFMRFTYAGKTVDVPVSEASKSGNYYNFFCRITSVNMTDDITAQMMVGNEAVGKSVTTSLEKYCSYIISTSKDTKTVNLMKAMLNYGATAQKMMNYNTNNLANKSLSEADKVLTAVNASAYAHSISGSEAGIKPVEALLVLGSETTIRVGFQLTGNKTIDQYTFTVDGVEVRPEYKGGKYVLEVPDIAAHLLDEYHTFTCGGITITYCGLSYVNQVMKGYTSGTTFDMAAALYNYSQATEVYIN